MSVRVRGLHEMNTPVITSLDDGLSARVRYAALGDVIPDLQGSVACLVCPALSRSPEGLCAPA
jgi:hypothetical protein